MITGRLFHALSPSPSCCQPPIPQLLGSLEERPGPPTPGSAYVFPLLLSVPVHFLTSQVSPPFRGQTLTAVTGQKERGWPFKATSFPPRAVWLGWRR